MNLMFILKINQDILISNKILSFWKNKNVVMLYEMLKNVFCKHKIGGYKPVSLIVK